MTTVEPPLPEVDTEALALPPAQWPTPLRILREASRLFAAKGYHGTSTRAIAAAVKVRQPSLFHHFPSKHAIAATLLELDLAPSLRNAERTRSTEGPVAARLYRYVYDEVLRGATSPFDLRGLYFTDVLDEPEFAEWGQRVTELHGHVTAVITEGIESGELVGLAPAFVARAVNALVLESLRTTATEPSVAAQLARNTAEFVLRGVLRDPDELAEIRRSVLDPS